MSTFTFFQKQKKLFHLVCLEIWLVVIMAVFVQAEENLDSFDEQILTYAKQCAVDVKGQFDLALASGNLTVGQLFDTFYIPIPDTNPQKYRTQYDKYSDEVVRPITDAYQKKHSRIIFVVPVDRNGYLPTHNTIFAQPLTGDKDYNAKWNRTKRIFNDTTGLAAASSQKTFLFQKYYRDTGEEMRDISVPIFINGQHWGAIRIGYK
jgi:methyl-accepting chemotaxis protein